MNPAVVIAAISAVAAVAAALITARTSLRASKVEDRKVDQSAYDQAIGFYEKQLERVTTQMDRLNGQLDRVTTQLASEQDVSNALRNQVRLLQTQVDTLSQMLTDLKGRTPTTTEGPSTT